MKILLVEDETKIQKFLSKGLKEDGHVVQVADDGETGYDLAKNEEFDLLILDVNLPRISGLALCKKLRSENIQCPVLMLTARDTVENKIEGLDSGADDYLTKPFSFPELLARVRALDRRQRKNIQTSLEINGLVMDQVAHKVHFEGKEVEFTSREFSLLQYMMRRKGHVLSRTVLADSVWGHDFDGGTNVIDVYVNYVRRKLKKATGQDWIQTHRHRGYSFEPPAE